MTRIPKVTTAQDTATLFNEKRFEFSNQWVVYGMLVKCECGNCRASYAPDEYLPIANEFSGYNAQLEQDRTELLEAAEPMLNDLKDNSECPACPGHNDEGEGGHVPACTLIKFAAAIARIKGEQNV